MTLRDHQTIKILGIPSVAHLLQQSTDLIHVIDMMIPEDMEMETPGLHIAVIFPEEGRPMLTTCLATDPRRRWSKAVSAWKLDPTMSSVRTILATPEWAEFIEAAQFDIVEPSDVEKAA
jgi:hypothetical protein